MAKVKKIDAPILILGLGGTGFDMLMRVKSEFSKRFFGEIMAADNSETNRPPRTEYCEIDTASDIGTKIQYGMRLEAGEFLDIGGDFDAIKGALNAKPYVREWLDQNVNSADINSDGAGCYRQVSRLMLFSNYNRIRMALMGKLQLLAQVDPSAADKSRRISVKIMAGVSGGTGSGTLLDVAYILRDIARANGYKINIEAYLMMPDVTIAHNAGGMAAKIKLYSINSYAFLKEMDYWMDAENTKISLTQQYSDAERVTWAGAPFDDVYLLSSQNDNGVAIVNSYEHNISAVAEYLVHCYESSNEWGDEAFEVEGSKDNGSTNAVNSFSFTSAHSNQKAIVDMLHHPYPVPTRYHSLGAYSNAGENHLMLVKEWSMIYDEAVTRFDTHHAVMDGLDPVEFKKNVLSLDLPQAGTASAVVHQEFNKRHPIPSFEDFDIDSLRSQDPSSAPHGTKYDNFLTGLRNTKGNEELKVAEELWQMFLAQARAVATDIARGPEFLFALLCEGQNSLEVALSSYKETVSNKKNEAGADMDSYGDHCRNSFDRFLHPGLMGRIFTDRQNYDDYLAKVRTLYEATQANAYYGALGEALKDFETKLKQYASILGDMVRAIKKQRNAYREELRNATNAAVAALFDTNAMTEDLTQKFANQTKRDTIVQSIYTGVADVAERLMAQNWTPEELPEMVNAAIDALRDGMFVGVGGLSLAQKIMTYQKVSAGQPLQNYVTNTLCPRLMSGAEVMFYPSPASLHLPNSIAAHTCMISVPQNAADIDQGIRAYCATNNLLAIIKPTMSSDRIFWVNDKGGLPLYFYGYIDVLRNEYIASRSAHKAYHLYMNDNPDARNAVGRLDEMKQAWVNVMPDPFIQRAQRETGRVGEALKRAEEQGMLRLDYKFEYDRQPEVEVYKCVFKPIGGVAVSRRTLGEALARIPFDQAGADALMRMEPTKVNEAAMREGLGKLVAYRDAIRALDDRRTREKLTFEHLNDAASEWGNVYGLTNDLVILNPAMDPDREEAIRTAWRTVYGRAIREALGRRPDIVAEMSDHADCRQLIAEKLGEVEAMIAKAQERIDEIPEPMTERQLMDGCRDVARMIMYKAIDVKNAKVNSTVIEGPTADVYRKGDDHTGLERMYKCFADFPILLQFAVWYSVEGKKQPGAIALSMDKARDAQEHIDSKDSADEETNAIKATATEWRGKLDKVKQDVMMAYADHSLDRAAYDLCNDMISWLTREFGSFIRTW